MYTVVTMVTFPNVMVAYFDLFLDQNGQKLVKSCNYSKPLNMQDSAYKVRAIVVVSAKELFSDQNDSFEE